MGTAHAVCKAGFGGGIACNEPCINNTAQNGTTNVCTDCGVWDADEGHQGCKSDGEWTGRR